MFFSFNFFNKFFLLDFLSCFFFQFFFKEKDYYNIEGDFIYKIFIFFSFGGLFFENMDTEEKAKEILNQIIKTIDNNCVELVKKVKKNMKKNISDSALCNKALEYYYDKFDNGIIKAKDKFALV